MRTAASGGNTGTAHCLPALHRPPVAARPSARAAPNHGVKHSLCSLIRCGPAGPCSMLTCRASEQQQQQQQPYHVSQSIQQPRQLSTCCCARTCAAWQHRGRIRCRSTTGGQPANPQQHHPQSATAAEQQSQGQQQQDSDTPLLPSVMPQLMHMQPPPQPVSVPPLLSWVPPQLLLHLKALVNFLHACWELLPEFVAPSLPEALRRLVLVLGASLALIVVVSTIDSGWLYLYLLNARHVPLAA